MIRYDVFFMISWEKKEENMIFHESSPSFASVKKAVLKKFDSKIPFFFFELTGKTDWRNEFLLFRDQQYLRHRWIANTAD